MIKSFLYSILFYLSLLTASFACDMPLEKAQEQISGPMGYSETFKYRFNSENTKLFFKVWTEMGFPVPPDELGTQELLISVSEEHGIALLTVFKDNCLTGALRMPLGFIEIALRRMEQARAAQ